jgi:hypothetical protein
MQAKPMAAIHIYVKNLVLTLKTCFPADLKTCRDFSESGLN